jgi:hypothetical protein
MYRAPTRNKPILPYSRRFGGYSQCMVDEATAMRRRLAM